ncbi:MAG: polyphosphate kinase 1 [Akkermansiaceae bacterium]|nr:polyphosphate kinase 1 [Akkermansiaceae bacterium]NNM30704.1 polyphosphate kinase 1 [Akkermansiaceae bacterium]
MPYINRELSWLEFNQRVLEEAQRDDNPLLERLKFLAITGSNLDEFFQVRVGGLAILRHSGSRTPDIAGLTPTKQIGLIRERALRMMTDQYALLNETLLPALRAKGVHILSLEELTPDQRDQADAYFARLVLPLLTPFAHDPEDPALLLPALEITVACRLENPAEGTTRYAFVPIPGSLPRFVSVSTGEGESFVYIEDLVRALVAEIFPGETVTASSSFRITRNSDIAVREEDAIDLAGEMEEVLAARRFSDTVRLQVAHGTPRDLLRVMQAATGSKAGELYNVPGPLALADFMQVAMLPGQDRLRDAPWPPQPSPLVEPGTSMFELIRNNDILLVHPFESFEPVLRFLEEAAGDPDVLAIKQVLYRTASRSRVIEALIKAAENGKQVTVLVELKARFDEERNLDRADALQRAGANIIYGVKGLKTHAKVLLITRREENGLRRYAHLGTGNYNETTAQFYTDISYLTARPDYGADLSLIFNAVTGRSKLLRLQKLSPAPTHMKRRLLELIAAETARARQGEPARIIAKMNSLQDQEMIDALFKASQAGVEVKLNIRGICCLCPGSGKGARNIRIVSVIDRFLEHARIFYFHRGGDAEILISSADWMTRNLEKRVELMVPIEDKPSRRRLVRILETAFKDNTNSFEILKDGTSRRLERPKGQKRLRMQEVLYQNAVEAAKARENERAATFEPHRPPED